jgi:hypothetical protein
MVIAKLSGEVIFRGARDKLRNLIKIFGISLQIMRNEIATSFGLAMTVMFGMLRYDTRY